MILPYSLHATFFTQDFDSWMNTNLQNEDNVNGRKWSRVFAVTLDNIWLYRNKTIFESFQFQPHGIVSKIWCQVDAVVVAASIQFQNALNLKSHKKIENKSISWTHPPIGSYKLNCDGVVNGDFTTKK